MGAVTNAPGCMLAPMDADRRPVDVIAGGLRQFVLLLTEAELRVVARWVDDELARARRPGLRLVLTPSAVSPAEFVGSFADLAGRVRKRITELPEDRLVVLSAWVDDRLRQPTGG